MTTFVLVPGAGGQAWYWHLLVPELEARGHAAVAVDLPAADEAAGLAEYADAVVDAAGSPGPDTVLVASSMGAFTAPLVLDRLPARMIVLLNAMTPRPGESPGEWWGAVGQEEAARANNIRDGRDPDAPFDVWQTFFHDAAPELRAAAEAGPPPEQADAPFREPWPLTAWPEVPTRFVAGRDDRLFPIEMQRRVVAERLGIEIDELPGGHLLALTQPVRLAETLVAYLA